MHYRILNANEWDKLLGLVEPTNHDKVPGPNTSSVAVAEDDQEDIPGCLFLQLALHMEPLILKSPKVSFERLVNTLLEAVKEHRGLHIYCFSDKEIIDKMAERVGMKLLPYKVFELVVK